MSAGLEATRQGIEVLGLTAPGLEVTRQGVELLGFIAPPDPGLEVTRQAVEVLGCVTPGLEVTRHGVEVLGFIATGLEVTRQGVEVLGTTVSGTFVSASNTLSLSDEAVGGLSIEVSASNTLSLSDSANGRNATIRASADNTLSLSQSAQVSRVLKRSATTPIYFAETTVDPLSFDEIEVQHGIFDLADCYVYIDPPPVETILSFAQRAHAVHVRADGISATASNTLDLSQGGGPTPTGNAASQLTLGQSASATAGRVATSTLALDQQASRTIERFVSAGSSLSLHQAVNVVLVEGCVTRTYTPFVGSTDDPNAPAPPSTNVPMLERVEGVQLYWPADVPTMIVTLRGPELDNKDRLRFQRINRETRGGTLVVFADPIWPKVQQLTLEFVGLEEDEAQSLLSFIGATLGKEIGLRDWENRHWAGVIVSPDEPIVRNGPHNISTALEFEGTPA